MMKTSPNSSRSILIDQERRVLSESHATKQEPKINPKIESLAPITRGSKADVDKRNYK